MGPLHNSAAFKGEDCLRLGHLWVRLTRELGPSLVFFGTLMANQGRILNSSSILIVDFPETETNLYV